MEMLNIQYQFVTKDVEFKGIAQWALGGKILSSLTIPSTVVIVVG
jgi:hypothetical protein